ncbi:CHAT domain-containing tetratricopeptide repeat protein, partial [Geitlerinema sp. P-1104]|uniref:CHAT domain-containing protein n=1 Tax=Geitlerinema sp. P-1104 TaxID=2546230 RepID=UPI0014777C43
MHVSRYLLALGLLTTLGLGLPRVCSALAEEPHRVVQSSVNRDFEPIEIRGQLDETSNVTDDGRYFNIYRFEGTEGQPLVIDLISDNFDAALSLMLASFEVGLITQDSYGGENTNAQIVVVLPRNGLYQIVTTSAQVPETGSYQLTLRLATSLDIERWEFLEEANRLNHQAMQLHQQGRYNEALPLARQALDICETALGPTHLYVAASLNNLAALYLDLGNYSEAELLYLRSLDIREITLGPTHLHVAQSLNNLAELHRDQGNYWTAEPLLYRSFEIYNNALEPTHFYIAQSLNNLAELYRNQGKFSEAELLYLQALEILETTLGETHTFVAYSLNNLALLYQNQGQYSDSESLYLRALNILETYLGKTHPHVAQSLNNLAALYQDQGQYGNSESLYLRALNILETHLGETHPHVAQSLNNLAELYSLQGNYRASEALLLRALDIRETRLGETHPDVATSLSNLANLYHKQGNHGSAEDLYRRALDIRETRLGKTHPHVANSLHNLATLYHAQGNYRASEALLLRALDIREAALGESHPSVASSLNNLAALYHDQGNYNVAEPLLHRSLEIRETTLGESHPDVATSLNNLANLYHEQGNYGPAEALHQRALEIREIALGESHPDVAQSLNNLALLYHDQENYSGAELLFLRTLDIWGTTLGETHPDLAITLNNLAFLYHDQGNYSAAEPLYLRGLNILETSLGETHNLVGKSLNNLALLYQVQGNTSESLHFLQRGLEIEETNLTQNLAIGSEARKQAYLATLTGTTHRTLSLHLQDAPNHPQAARLALTTVLRRKGRILDAVTETQQLLRDNLSPELTPLLDEYTNAQTQLANRLYAGLGDQDPDIYRTEIDTLRQRVEQLENDLSRRSAEFRVATEPVEIEVVQALIPNDATLVELVQYFPFDSTSFNWGTPRYAAYILHASGAPQWVDLGDANTIDHAAFAFLNATRVPNSEQRVQTTGRQLDELLMAPIRPLLGDATHLLLSPDGQLNLIPFAALVDEENRYLVESYQLTHLTTGRDLLRLQYPRPSRQPPVLFANPNYDDADTSAVMQVAQASRGESQRSMEIEDLQFGELPGTQREVEAIAPLLDNPIILTEAEATENALKQVQAPSILHLATHGFFLQDVEFVPPQPMTDFTRGDIELVTAGGSGSFAAPPSDRPTSRENPLLRSGLAFAGFNTRDSEGEDGVLTALEVVGLDLRGTRLVVMSACETGVGDVANGEGVYGLRRA